MAERLSEERLAGLRRFAQGWAEETGPAGYWSAMVEELLDHIDVITEERDRARDVAAALDAELAKTRRALQGLAECHSPGSVRSDLEAIVAGTFCSTAGHEDLPAFDLVRLGGNCDCGGERGCDGHWYCEPCALMLSGGGPITWPEEG